VKPIPDALDTIDAALKAVAHWNPDKPDEKKRAVIYAAMHAGFQAAHDLTAPEGTTSQNAKAKQRRDRLTAQRYWTMFGDLAARNEPLDDNWVTVARAAAWLGRLLIMITREDFIDARKRRKGNIEAGKLSAGEEAPLDWQRWDDYAKRRKRETPTVNATQLAHEIHRDKELNPKGKAFGTINNYLGKIRANWDPEHR
jgi:hypothetical protein